ncbi:imidazolonepropionase [Acidobacteriota bacterium]
MRSADLVVKNLGQLLTCQGSIPKRGKALRDLGQLEDTTIASYKGKIVFIGHFTHFEKKFSLEEGGEIFDGCGQIGLPGFVDSHNHLPFAGSREKEFALRLSGYTYQQLAAQGMGIQTTVKATRQATQAELESLCLKRLDSMLLHGTTTTEGKSGYGLNREDEIKQLEALRTANSKHPIEIISTFLGAHEIPPEFREDKSSYIDLLIGTILPEIKEKKLAQFVDVFCEEGVYTIEETRRIIRAASALGMKAKIHADEFAPLNGAILAAEEGALSADHLMAITPEGIKVIAQSETAATFLPAVSFFLMHEKKAPARDLIDSGAIVALASDFNPGSSMTESMHFIMQLAVFTMKMEIEEAITAATANAAYAIGQQDRVGSLEVGKQMDLVLCEIPNYLYLVYHLGINPVTHVIKNGKIVVKNRQLVYSSK